MTATNAIEAASTKEPPSFLVGCDDQNHWVAMEVHGLCGGFFADQESALKFAYEETSWREGAVQLVKRVSAFPAPANPSKSLRFF
jgi:hypothetical protein